MYFPQNWEFGSALSKLQYITELRSTNLSDVPFYGTCKHAVADIKLQQNVFGVCYNIQHLKCLSHVTGNTYRHTYKKESRI
jgi:hypothetical protein